MSVLASFFTRERNSMLTSGFEILSQNGGESLQRLTTTRQPQASLKKNTYRASVHELSQDY